MALSSNTTEQPKEQEEITAKIRVKIRAYDNKIIDKSTKTIIDTVTRSGAQVIGPVPLPTEKTVYTVLKSTFVYKNARDQFEMRVHKRLMDIVNANAKTIDALSNLNLPAGVDIEIKMM
jgi:small subunit ribosomal protein S10